MKQRYYLFYRVVFIMDPLESRWKLHERGRQESWEGHIVYGFPNGPRPELAWLRGASQCSQPSTIVETVPSLCFFMWKYTKKTMGSSQQPGVGDYLTQSPTVAAPRSFQSLYCFSWWEWFFILNWHVRLLSHYVKIYFNPLSIWNMSIIFLTLLELVTVKLVCNNKQLWC